MWYNHNFCMNNDSLGNCYNLVIKIEKLYAGETTVFQERQNKAQLQYSRVAEGKNCEAQNSNFCVNFCRHRVLTTTPTIASTSILELECLRFGSW